MKKTYAMLLAALAGCALSCNKGPLEVDKPSQEGRTVTFTATIEENDVTTKTSYVNGKTFWVKGDVVKINGYDFDVILPDNAEQSATATFTGVVGADFKAPYTAVYGKYSPVQKAVKDNYDPSVVELAATSDNAALLFKNTTALLKFNVRDANVHSLSFVSGEEAVVLNAEEGKTLSGTYYMAIRPKSFAKFDIKFNGTDIVKTYINGKPFNASAGHSYNMGDVRHSTYFLKGNKAATHQDKEWDKGGIEFIDCGKTQYGQQYVLLNHTFDPGAEFKLIYKEPGKWFGLKIKDAANNVYWLDANCSNFKPAAGTYNLYLKEDYTLVMQKVK